MSGEATGWRAFRVVFAVLGIAFLAVAFWRTWEGEAAPVLPHWTTIVAAFASVVLGLAAAAYGWAALFEGAGSLRRLAHGLYVAQFGKHIPGGIWQAVGQIGLAVGPGVSAGKAAVVYPVQVVAQVVAGLSVGALFGLAGGSAPGWMRGAALFGVVGLVLLHRPWMAAAADRVRSLRGLEGSAPVPSQAAILRCYAAGVITFLFSGLGFALLLGPAGALEAAAAMGVFGLAWVIGFLVLPFPSGIGVREAVMMAALGSGVAPVIAASLLHRVVTMAAETVLALVTWRPR